MASRWMVSQSIFPDIKYFKKSQDIIKEEFEEQTKKQKLESLLKHYGFEEVEPGKYLMKLYDPWFYSVNLEFPNWPEIDKYRLTVDTVQDEVSKRYLEMTIPRKSSVYFISPPYVSETDFYESVRIIINAIDEILEKFDELHKLFKEFER